MPRLEMYDPDDPRNKYKEGCGFYHTFSGGEGPRVEFPSKDVRYEDLGITQVPELALAHEMGHHKSGVGTKRPVPFFYDEVIEEELLAWEEVIRWKLPLGHWGTKERIQAAGLLGEYYRYPDHSINRRKALRAIYKLENKVRRELEL